MLRGKLRPYLRDVVMLRRVGSTIIPSLFLFDPDAFIPPPPNRTPTTNQAQTSPVHAE